MGLRSVEDLSRDVLVDVVQVSEAGSLILCWGSCWGEEERGGRGVKCRNREVHGLGLRGVEDVLRNVLMDVVQASDGLLGWLWGRGWNRQIDAAGGVVAGNGE